MKQVESYFKTHANDECFTTSDGMVFHKKGDANLHASSLEDKEVVPHKRAKYAGSKVSKEEKISKETKEPKTPKETKAAKDSKETKPGKENKADETKDENPGSGEQ